MNTEPRTATAAHTPGPWFVEGMRVKAGDFQYLPEHQTGGAPAAEYEANARLIAAAPDLLALARLVAMHFESTDAPLERMARDIIAKATGAAS